MDETNRRRKRPKKINTHKVHDEQQPISNHHSIEHERTTIKNKTIEHTTTSRSKRSGKIARYAGDAKFFSMKAGRLGYGHVREREANGMKRNRRLVALADEAVDNNAPWRRTEGV